jgi:nitrogen fixation protein NifX
MVQACKIFPMQSAKENEKIEDILNLLIKLKSNPPIWMRRLLENES